MIVSGSTAQSLAAALAAELDEELAPVEYDRFPDGELLAAAPEFAADRAVVVASTTSSDAHVELLQLQDAVREAGAQEVVTVLPYMGYARQDDPVAPGETLETTPSGYPLSARAVARAISTGTDRVVTVNPHEEAVLSYFEVPATSVDAAGRLAEPLPTDLTEPLFLAPDRGATDLAESARDAYGRGTVDHFEKTRHSGSEVSVTGSDTPVEGRDVVLVDDIVATGSTMSETIEVIEDRGAAGTYVTCVHPVLTGSARIKLARAGVEAVFATDTIERATSSVSAAPTIADAL
jgi:ribose-phosphate pyrophosphokinase